MNKSQFEHLLCTKTIKNYLTNLLIIIELQARFFMHLTLHEFFQCRKRKPRFNYLRFRWQLFRISCSLIQINFESILLRLLNNKYSRCNDTMFISEEVLQKVLIRDIDYKLCPDKCLYIKKLSQPRIHSKWCKHKWINWNLNKTEATRYKEKQQKD